MGYPKKAKMKDLFLLSECKEFGYNPDAEATIIHEFIWKEE